MRRLNAAIGQRRLLIVLDDAWQAEPLDHLRTTGPNVVQILTTRDQAIARKFAGANQEVTVPVLEEAPSHALLRTLAPEAWDADPAAAARLADQVGGLPLALELLGGYLAEPERSLFPELSEPAFADLADPAKRLALAQVRLGSVSGERQTLAETIALSLDELAEVRPEAVDAFYALGAFAPKPARFDLDAAKAVTKADAATLALLVGRSLLEQEDGALALHQTLSDVAETRIPCEVIQKHRAYYIAIVDIDQEDWQTIEAIYPQIMFAWKKAVEISPNDRGELPEFVWTLRTYQERRGLWADKLTWAEAALAEAQVAEDVTTICSILGDIGYVHQVLGDKQRALGIYTEALAMHRQLGNKTMEAAMLNDIGLVHFDLGEMQQALDFYTAALDLHRQVERDKGGATTVHNIGLVYSDLGDKQLALQFFDQALTLHRRTGNIAGEAASLMSIGAVYSSLRDADTAIDMYSQALALDRQIGDITGEATTLNNIGMIYLDLHDRRKAISFFNQALSLHRQVGNKTMEATTLNNIGLVYDNQNELLKALAYYTQALHLTRQVGNIAGEATTLHNIGRVYSRQGEIEKSIDRLHRSVELAHEIGLIQVEAAHLYSLAEVIANKSNAITEAMNMVSKAIHLLEQHDLAYTAYGTSIDSLRESLAKLGRKAASRERRSRQNMPPD